MKKPEEKRSKLIKAVALIGAAPEETTIFHKYTEIVKAVYFARDLVNGNADDVTPQYLAAAAQQLAKKHSRIKTTIFDKKRLIKERFGLLLAVNRGSLVDPALIVAEYRGAPKSSLHIVLIGKGVTYDTGGLNLKPTGSMETMKADMAGAAAVLGALSAIASLNLKVNVSVVVPSTENGIDSLSYKPGDVYEGYAGKSVEIGNTDAEGRLILADALAYAVKELKPTYLIDLATLTGAMDVALGSEYIGLFSNDDNLSRLLEDSSLSTYERVWRLPLVDEYRDSLKSDIADLRNIGGKGAGCIKGALFLEAFVDKIAWAHLDIASVAYSLEAKKYLPKYGTGIGVRLLVDFLENLIEQSCR
jgi:leucyl aminopeptidase